MEKNHENDSEGRDCRNNRIFSIGIRCDDGVYGRGRADRTPGHYCLSYDYGGTDCSFTSYAQCEATASGEAAECYGKTIRDDENSQIQGHRGYDSRAQGY